MSRRVMSRDVAPIWQVIVYLDSEYQDQYASIADTLGETSQLENDFPLLELEKGDVLLTVNDQNQKDQDTNFKFVNSTKQPPKL